MERAQVSNLVGPVLQVGTVADAVIAAIEQLNERVLVVDRGAYKRVLVPARCRLTRTAVEDQLGRPFELPIDLERLMVSFRGRLEVSPDMAEWFMK